MKIVKVIGACLAIFSTSVFADYSPLVSGAVIKEVSNVSVRPTPRHLIRFDC